MKRFALLMVAVFGIVRAEIIPDSGRVVWSGNVGVTGGIPTRTNIFATFAAGASSGDINTALAACPSNQVVLLGEGTFTLTNSLTIKHSGVTLRGAGPDKTILNFDGPYSYALIYFQGTGYIADPPNLVADWVSGFDKGETNVSFTHATNLSVGMVLCLDQLNEPGVVSKVGSEGTCTYCSRSSGDRGQMQYARVAAISGTNITIWPPLYMGNWTDTLTPQAWWWGSSVTRSGVEDLKIGTNTRTSIQYNVGFVAADSCWVKNIESSTATVAHVRTYWSYGIEIRDSYFHHTLNYASQSYGADVTYSSGCLVENNIFESITTPLIFWGGASGNVAAYNYCTNMRYDTSPSWLSECLATHGVHTCMNLFEGNYITSAYFDNTHGSGSHNTLFRNRVTGWEVGKSANTYPLVIEATNRHINVVGNVLGTTGYHDRYDYISGSTKAIRVLGFFGVSHSTNGFDTNISSTLLMHGNYDMFNASTQWDLGIADTNIINSYYLTEKPSWFGNLSWPSAGPDIAGLENTLPAEVRFVGELTPVISSQPTSIYRQVGTSATFTITATGTAPLSCQWLKGASAITDATNATYTISSCVLGDTGSYSCTVTNAYGSATSGAAVLSVNYIKPRAHIRSQ